MMADIFAKLKWNNIDCEMCSEFAKELVYNILLKRDKPYNPNGRNETEDQALKFDELVENTFVKDWSIMDDRFVGCEYNSDRIATNIKQVVSYFKKK